MSLITDHSRNRLTTFLVRFEPLERRVLLHEGHLETGTGLVGEYFAAPDQTNLLLSRAEPEVNFNWGKQSPSPELTKDNFSVRWTPTIPQPAHRAGRPIHLPLRVTATRAAVRGVRVECNTL